MVDVTARLGICPRCKSPAIPGVHCHQCAVDSERALALVERMRRFADLLVWVEAEAMFRDGVPGVAELPIGQRHEGRMVIATMLLALRAARRAA